MYIYRLRADILHCIYSMDSSPDVGVVAYWVCCYYTNRAPTSSGFTRPIWVVWGVAYICRILIPVVNSAMTLVWRRRICKYKCMCLRAAERDRTLYKSYSSGHSRCTSILTAARKSWFCYSNIRNQFYRILSLSISYRPTQYALIHIRPIYLSLSKSRGGDPLIGNMPWTSCPSYI